jgi:hypothetical protein
LKRPTEKQSSSAENTGCPDAAFVNAYPQLLAYLTDAYWEDGKPRELSSASFTLKDGLWQLAVNDKALKQSLYTAGPTIKDCLRLAEKAIADGSGQWRLWKRGK